MNQLTNIRYFFPLLAGLLLGLGSCKENTITPETFGSVFGEVLVQTENVPLSEASISTTPPTGTYLTDTAGRFAIENIATGTYTLRIEKEGFISSLENVAVFDEQTSNVVIRLEPDTLENTAPLAPFDPQPSDGASNLSINPTLLWSASDPDEDALSFEVLLFNSDQTLAQTVASNITDTTLTLSDLEYGATYFWQVIASDGKEEVFGEVWTFSTEVLPDLRYFYARPNNGNFRIYAANSTGTSIALTEGNGSFWRPRMSPLRDKVAYISNQGVEPQLYLSNRDGSAAEQLTTIPIAGYNNLELDFCWSPDGAQLLYMSNTRLYRINRDGTGLMQIGTAPLGWTFTECDWTAAGDLILVRLTGINSYNSQLFTMDQQGTFLQAVVADLPGSLGGGMFSINGTEVLYTQDVSGFESPDGRQLDSHIFIKNISTQSVIDLSLEKPDGTNDLDARFAPDGASVIFVNTNNDGVSSKSIWRVDLNGENRELLFENAEMPEWK